MDAAAILALDEGLKIGCLEPTATLLTCFVAAIAPGASCPLCGEWSAHLHSHYRRKVADLPCGGRQVRLLLVARKFRCKNRGCPRKVFAERFAPLVEPWARMTTRLGQALLTLGLATCGEGGARVAAKLSMHTSPTTILRRVMAMPIASNGVISELGIDDFSFLRGRRFGTILVNLSRHQVVDLLPDRSVETAATWMARHPEIELVSRDRGEDYAAAVRIGAPQAQQVADRFHLVQNLTASVEVILARCRTELHRAAKPPVPAPTPEGAPTEEVPAALEESHVLPAPAAGKVHLARHAERVERYEQLLTLRQTGVPTKDIAQRLGMGERTIRYWVRRGIPYGTPELRSKRHRTFDPYAAYVTERWRQGCQNGVQLWREITEQGFKGGYSSLYRFLETLREPTALARRKGQSEPSPSLPEVPMQHVNAKEAVWWFVRSPTDLEEAEQHQLTLLRQISPTADCTYDLVQEFVQMVRKLEGQRLPLWLERARASQIPELRHFARGIERDYAAVVAGLSVPQSNGMVEGFVTKLKLVKRSMYGRAGFALLRQRLLHSI